MDTDRDKTRFYASLSALDRHHDEPDAALDKGQSESRQFLETAKAATKLLKASRANSFHSIRPEKDKDLPSASSTFHAPSQCEKGTRQKRRGALELVPEAQRIFNNLNFFFFPNNDTNAVRRIKIQKAMQYGANWTRDWTLLVTHVVVDKSVTFQQLLAYLKLDSIPASVVIVNEDYPASCIIFRELLVPDSQKFPVAGYSLAERASSTAKSSETSATTADPGPVSLADLPLKPPRRDRIARRPQTPSASDQSSVEAPKLTAQDKREQSRETSVPLYDDALSEAIGRAKLLQDLPIEADEQEVDVGFAYEHVSATDSESEAEAPGPPRPKRRRLAQDEKFQCMNKHDGSTKGTNPNAETIEILGRMASYYEGTKDEWRVQAYRKAISVLRNQTEKITTKEQAQKLPYVGERLAAKIEEIALTHKLRRLDNTEGDSEHLRLFTKIYGVGLTLASKWAEQGFRTLDDIRANVKLTPNQTIGINHYDDFLARIPRPEVEQCGNAVRNALHSIDRDFQVIIGGSFRRGAVDSGDIDCIITRPNTDPAHLRAVVIDQLVPALFAAGFLKCTLAACDATTGSKWHGACAVPGRPNAPWRRIDLLLVPGDELGAALVYFTGNDVFNRSIRLLASSKGMRLNQHGLFKDVMRGRQRVRDTDGTLLESKCERRIFDILGVPWRPPEHRIC